LPQMVATKIATPLYLVATPADVPDRFHVTGHNVAIFRIPGADLVDVRTFVTRDLAQALGVYFTTVVVVDDPAELPATRHVMGRVQLRRIELDRQVSPGHHGQKNEFRGALEWGFGLKVSDQPEFLFTVAERTASARQMMSADDDGVYESMFEEALRHVLVEYGTQGVQEKLARSER
jgi:hypothetical protein